MIYTVTFNPSIDYIVTVPKISYEDVNRVTDEYIQPGGKGINVSVVLSNIGIRSIATGFVSGFTGEHIIHMLDASGICNDFIHTETGMSRINIKIKTDSECEINGMGPKLNKRHIDELFRRLSDMKPGDYLVLAGSVQQSVGSDIYRDLAEYAATKNVRCVVDASGELLLNSISARPFLIKPNLSELEAISKRQLNTMYDIISAARTLQDNGAANVLVSMAGDGALLLTCDQQIYYAYAPKGNVINSVGCGDSMVAGFIAAQINGFTYADSLKYAVCAGSASAFKLRLATQQDIDKLLDKVTIERRTI